MFNHKRLEGPFLGSKLDSYQNEKVNFQSVPPPLPPPNRALPRHTENSLVPQASNLTKSHSSSWAFSIKSREIRIR